MFSTHPKETRKAENMPGYSLQRVLQIDWCFKGQQIKIINSFALHSLIGAIGASVFIARF